MMKLVYAFYEEGAKALDGGASISNLVNAQVRERIGRFKYTHEDAIDEEYEKISAELGKEISSMIGKEDL